MFVAVVPPEPVAEALDEFLEPRRDADDRLRWTPRSAWHVTTAFCASVAAAFQSDINREMELAELKNSLDELRSKAVAAKGNAKASLDTSIRSIDARRIEVLIQQVSS